MSLALQALDESDHSELASLSGEVAEAVKRKSAGATADAEQGRLACAAVANNALG